MFYYSLQVHVADTIFFIVIIPPCLINSIIIKFLCVFDCMVHRWLMLCLFCVRVCNYPPLLPQSFKSREDQTDYMKYSGMEETGNHQVLLLQINL